MQSLSFVLTLPLFIMIVLFIIQVSQLMMGLMTIQYAAFSAARSAMVWAPAHVRASGAGYSEEFENVLQPPLAEENPLRLEFNGQLSHNGGGADYQDASLKLQRMFAAAVLGMAPVAPSRHVIDMAGNSRGALSTGAIQEFYRRLDPASQSNSRIVTRLNNKLAYSHWNTRLRLAFVDKDQIDGPTYNPKTLIIVDGMAVTDEEGEFQRQWIRHEVGWQDPLILTVSHDFALLPGPGRFLARYLVQPSGGVDEAAEHIQTRQGEDGVPFTRPVHTVTMSASATLTNEGFKPLLSYLQDMD